MPARNTPERFWNGLHKRDDGCWLWTGTINEWGYGTVGYHRRIVGAHRLAWELKHGSIPKGLFVCHKCDVPACCNPSHLFLGTPKDNSQDSARKGRWTPRPTDHLHLVKFPPKGERNGRAKLTADDVRIIRYAHAHGRTQKALAERYGVKPVTIQAITSRRNWTHI